MLIMLLILYIVVICSLMCVIFCHIISCNPHAPRGNQRLVDGASV